MQKAIELLEKIHKENPDDIIVLKTLVEIAFLNNDEEKAIKYLNLAFEVKPLDLVILNQLGAFHLKRDEIQEAAFYYQKSLEVNPKQTDVIEKCCSLGLENEDNGKEETVDKNLSINEKMLHYLESESKSKAVEFLIEAENLTTEIEFKDLFTLVFPHHRNESLLPNLDAYQIFLQKRLKLKLNPALPLKMSFVLIDDVLRNFPTYARNKKLPVSRERFILYAYSKLFDEHYSLSDIADLYQVKESNLPQVRIKTRKYLLNVLLSNYSQFFKERDDITPFDELTFVPWKEQVEETIISKRYNEAQNLLIKAKPEISEELWKELFEKLIQEEIYIYPKEKDYLKFLTNHNLSHNSNYPYSFGVNIIYKLLEKYDLNEEPKENAKEIDIFLGSNNLKTPKDRYSLSKKNRDSINRQVKAWLLPKLQKDYSEIFQDLDEEIVVTSEKDAEEKSSSYDESQNEPLPALIESFYPGDETHLQILSRLALKQNQSIPNERAFSLIQETIEKGIATLKSQSPYKLNRDKYYLRNYLGLYNEDTSAKELKDLYQDSDWTYSDRIKQFKRFLLIELTNLHPNIFKNFDDLEDFEIEEKQEVDLVPALRKQASIDKGGTFLASSINSTETDEALEEIIEATEIDSLVHQELDDIMNKVSEMSKDQLGALGYKMSELFFKIFNLTIQKRDSYHQEIEFLRQELQDAKSVLLSTKKELIQAKVHIGELHLSNENLKEELKKNKEFPQMITKLIELISNPDKTELLIKAMQDVNGKNKTE